MIKTANVFVPNRVRIYMANGINNLFVQSVIFSAVILSGMGSAYAQDQQTTTTTTTTVVAPQTTQTTQVQVVPQPVVPTPIMNVTPADAVPVQAVVVPVQTPPAPVDTNADNERQFQEWLQSSGVTSTSTSASTTTQVTSTDPALANVHFPQVRSPADIPEGNGVPPRTNGRRPVSFEEGQQIMVDSAPDSLVPQDPDAQFAFNTMMQQNMPLSPQQTVKLRQQIDVSQRAASIQPNVPPKPISSTIMVNLAPGTTPPAIRLAQGYVSSMVFVDSTGEPWPIAAFDIGNPKSVNIQWDGKSNIILIQGVQPYSDGNMVIRLVGLATPITLEIVSGQRVVDYRIDLHVPGIGPNGQDIALTTTLPNSASSLLLGVLDGVAPPGSRALEVIGADAQAWLLGQRMFLRTRLTVLSPGWIGTMVSPDGMHAYEMTRTSTILVSKFGEPAELRVEGF